MAESYLNFEAGRLSANKITKVGVSSIETQILEGSITTNTDIVIDNTLTVKGDDTATGIITIEKESPRKSIASISLSEKIDLGKKTKKRIIRRSANKDILEIIKNIASIDDSNLKKHTRYQCLLYGSLTLWLNKSSSQNRIVQVVLPVCLEYDPNNGNNKYILYSSCEETIKCNEVYYQTAEFSTVFQYYSKDETTNHRLLLYIGEDSTSTTRDALWYIYLAAETGPTGVKDVDLYEDLDEILAPDTNPIFTIFNGILIGKTDIST